MYEEIWCNGREISQCWSWHCGAQVLHLLLPVFSLLADPWLHLLLPVSWLSIDSRLLFWKLDLFLGVLNFLVYMFYLLGAPPWPPPKSLLQMFIFINAAYPRQEIGKGGEPESFTKTLWHSALEVISAGGCPGQSALTLDLPFPLPSRNHCTGYLQSETLCISEPRILSWKADGGLQYPGLTLGGTIFFTLQRKNLNHKWNWN